MAESEVLSQHLRAKFSSILQEAESDPSSPTQIITRFRSIERTINFMSESTTPIPLDLLYKLIDALSEIRILAHQRQNAAASKKGFFRAVPVTITRLSQLLFLRKKNLQLKKIEHKLKNPPESKQDGSSTVPKLVIQQTYPVHDASRIIGFESQSNKIESWLIDNISNTDGLTAVGITGRCGCGKTALAQKVFSSPRIQNEFSPRIWVCLSNMLFERKGVDTRVRVLHYILEEIGYDISELQYSDYSLNELLEKLKVGLTGKRYLIVLDDAWRVDEWYADLDHCLPRGSSAAGELFTHGLPKGSGGGVIVTSRREKVIRRTVRENRVVRLEHDFSNDDTVWKIFGNGVKELGKIKVSKQELEEYKEDVIRSCDGLPMAAWALVHILPRAIASRTWTRIYWRRVRTYIFWENILSKLREKIASEKRSSESWP